MHTLVLFFALIGHAGLWVAVVNRIHGFGWSRPTSHRLTFAAVAAFTLIPLACGWWLWPVLRGDVPVQRLPAPLVAYIGLCELGAVVMAVGWLYRTLAASRVPGVLRHRRQRTVAMPRTAADLAAHHPLARLLGNESLTLEITEQEIEVPRLPAALDRLSVLHISDLHFTGRVGRAWFEEVVRQANLLEPDLVALTGDVVDAPEYIDWIPETVGRLAGRHGAYFVLGNHDRDVDAPRVRRVLTRGVGGSGGTLDETGDRRGGDRVGGERGAVVRGGGTGRCAAAGAGGRVGAGGAGAQPGSAWLGAARQVDLMLAGHLHGGQVRLPVLGPLVAPSRMGVRYAAGLFYAAPTILHVSRGVSGEVPLRWNCAGDHAAGAAGAGSVSGGGGTDQVFAGKNGDFGEKPYRAFTSGFRGGGGAFDDVAHELGGGVEAGEELELVGGLADEHVDAGDDEAIPARASLTSSVFSGL